ncbi:MULTISPECIES: argininosuccinate lyase [unclassified Fusibacter]|uniref:argininosuccinate lyase n=1 Tax=unclassified Fusibacter TaxID=2624464 RepID=UPI001010A06B|nr:MULTISPECIES: argininosuccinate lyase [unclassified Fusibacter]MCK8059508.1 argininosuccinate lyase [Fusibacter sp. A2]NPE21028.1 argininosuccinate lyase [Fusibacter sp. A1]RXV62302.1 argininosuccinate lyase [Fusibacter sp. A1]
MSTKMWAGRFSKDQSELFDRFNASIGVDYFLAASDIEGSIAHAKGLCKLGIFSEDELDTVTEALMQISAEIVTGELVPTGSDEDVHMWVERVLSERTGVLGKKLHTARSRNDQVATATKIWMRQAVMDHKMAVVKLIEVLVDLGRDTADTLMPGLTHLQHAQPITMGFHLLSYVEMFKRDFLKLNHILAYLDTCPLGAGALAGTNYDMDREFVAGELGFSKLAVHAMDAVSDRDYVLDYLNWVSVSMIHLSRLSDEMILWNSPNFSYIRLSDEVTSGSSIMPNKKNPDACELIRGKASVATARLSAMQGILKALPLAYNKDLQEDKKLLLEAYTDTVMSIEMMTLMLEGISFDESKMKRAVKLGFMNATDLADALVLKGVPFREAHELVGRVVKVASDKDCPLEDLRLSEFHEVSNLFDSWVYEVLDYTVCLNNKKSVGSTSVSSVNEMLTSAYEWLAERK